MEQRLHVHQDGAHIYDIVFEENFHKLAKELQSLGYASSTKILIVTDSNVGPIYQETLKNALSDIYESVFVHVLDAGEENKNLSAISKVYETLIRNHFNRNDLMVALGGGVVGDMTGFTAATFLRGIDFVQIPTTLLAMVDSSVGGKTGVDYEGYKNMVGAFYMPKLVYMNLSVLSTLPDREVSCGMAEVIKYGYIFDKPFIAFLQEHDMNQIFSIDFIKEIVYRCCDHKRRVVEEDPKEHGVRSLLNYGHTIGHAIEKLKNFQLLHGECVSLGMCAAAWISKQRGDISEEEYEESIRLLNQYRLPTTIDFTFTPDEVLFAMRSDKKVLSGTIRMILLSKVGDAYVDSTCSEEEILAAIESIMS